jgi:hypothetical protein
MSAPPSPEVSCAVWTGREWGVVWTVRHEPHTVGLSYRFARHGADGKPLGEPVDAGWSAAGLAVCRLAWNGERWALAFPFLDPVDDDAELRLHFFDAVGARVGGKCVARGRGCDFEPITLEAEPSGWRLSFRRFIGSNAEEFRLNHEGAPR